MTVNCGRAGVTVNYHSVETVVIDASRQSIESSDGHRFRAVEIRISDGETCRTVHLFGEPNVNDGRQIRLHLIEKHMDTWADL